MGYGAYVRYRCQLACRVHHRQIPCLGEPDFQRSRHCFSTRAPTLLGLLQSCKNSAYLSGQHGASRMLCIYGKQYCRTQRCTSTRFVVANNINETNQWAQYLHYTLVKTRNKKVYAHKQLHTFIGSRADAWSVRDSDYS